MSDSGWTDELVAEREREIVERGKRFLSEQERVRAANGFVGALSEIAGLPVSPLADRATAGGASDPIKSRKREKPFAHDEWCNSEQPIHKDGPCNCSLSRQKPARKPRIRGLAPKEDRSYEGRCYHSKNEMLYAAKLDLLLKAGKIQRVEPQIRIPLTVNGALVCTMVVDFLIVNNDGTREYHEVKGMESDVWKLKRKLLKACRPDINYVVVKV